MKRTLYSLMLSENVVHQVDQLAHKMGISRSALINQILADYVDYTTPERRIHDVFSAVESLVRSSCELVPFVSPNTMTMSLKSSLEYKYRPTVKYEVELYRSGEQQLGALDGAHRRRRDLLVLDDEGLVGRRLGKRFMFVVRVLFGHVLVLVLLVLAPHACAHRALGYRRGIRRRTPCVWMPGIRIPHRPWHTDTRGTHICAGAGSV